jgi:hypothetical protein
MIDDATGVWREAGMCGDDFPTGVIGIDGDDLPDDIVGIDGDDLPDGLLGGSHFGIDGDDFPDDVGTAIAGDDLLDGEGSAMPGDDLLAFCGRGGGGTPTFVVSRSSSVAIGIAIDAVRGVSCVP